jgi:hypothetical protein
MNIPIGVLSMFPLQSYQMGDFWKKSSQQSSGAEYFAIGIGVVVIVLIVLNVFKDKLQPKVGGKHVATSGPRRFTGFTLHRLTSDMGFDREQVKMLDYVLRSGSVTDPERVLNNSALLDKHFKRAYRLIEKTSSSEEELNDRVSVLFSARNLIDAHIQNSTTTSSTRQIPEKTPAVLTIDKVNYPVKVLSSKGDTLVVENPQRSAGSRIHPANGSQATLALYTKSSKAFSIETRVLGSTDTADGPALKLAHSGKVKKLSARRFRRLQVIIDTGFFFFYSDGNKKSVVDKRRNVGKIMDISIGGCSIKTTTSVNQGQKIKVEFIHNDGSTIAALGEVLRISRNGVNTVIHIHFLKVPRRSSNSINAMVYEYEE